MPAPLRIGVVGFPTERPPGASRVARYYGVTLGIYEAKRAAELFGGEVEVVSVGVEDFGRTPMSAVIGDDNAETCGALSRTAAERRVVFVNVGCTADALRVGGCGSFTFHVVPSDAMLRDALTQAGRGDRASPTAWDPSLVRFGADTLNQRFRAAFGRPMTADAWTAWFAVKVLWESSLRAKSSSAVAIRDYLQGDTTQFDGHKGLPLSFRTWDHQLRQPLYVVEPTANGAEQVVAELPVTGATESFREALDRLGVSQVSSVPCGRTR